MEQMNMMPNGMPAQGQPSMQRPQPGNPQQQIHAQIMISMKAKLHMFAGSWQALCDIRDRAIKVFQIYSQLCMIEPNNNSKCLHTAMSFEHETISRAPSKEAYNQLMNKKLNDINSRRQQTAQNLMMMGNDPRNSMPGMNGPNPNQMNNNFGGMPNQMQRPPMPNMMQQPPQQPTMDPSALNSAPPMQPQMSNGGNRQPRMNATPNPGQQQQPTQTDVQRMAQHMFTNLSDEKRELLRRQVFQGMNETQRQQFASSRKDPLVQYLLGKARDQLIRQRGQPGGQPNAQMGNIQAPMGGGQQGNIFDFSAIMNQQTDAMKLAESGEQVVPASNNNNGYNQQMNTPNPQMGGINPAMLRNNQGGNGQPPNAMNPQNAQNVQQMMLQREKARQDNMAAKQQAMMNAQLQGQPGGLNTPNALTGAAGGSPAMSMLNRPMQPPGSQPPTTPQQPNRAPNMPPNQPPSQMQNGQANALLQHHQNMLNRNNPGANMQGGPAGGQLSMDQKQKYNAIMRTLPAAAHERIRNMKPHEIEGLFASMANQSNRPPGMQDPNGPQPGSQGGMNMMPDLQQPPPMQGGNQPRMPPNMGNPQMGGRMPNQMQQAPQMAQMPNPANMNLPPAIKTSVWMSRPFPQEVLQQLGITVPPQVRVWGQLRQHIEANQHLVPPGTRERINVIMQRWCSENPKEFELGFQQMVMSKQQQKEREMARQGMQNGMPNMNMNQNFNMPNRGQAPPAQMVPNVQGPPGLGGPPGGPPQGPLRLPPQGPITAQDIAIFRQKFPRFASVPEETARSLIDQVRNSQPAQAQALRQAQMQHAGPQGPQGPQGRSGPQPPNNTRTPMPNNAGQQAPPQQPPQQQQQTGQKRPQPPPSSNDDVMEIPNPNPNPSAAASAPQAQKMRQSNSQQQHAPQQNLSNEQQLQVLSAKSESIANPTERADYVKRMAALRAANNGLSNVANRQPAPNAAQGNSAPPHQIPMIPTEEEKETIRKMMEDAKRTVVKGPPVHMDQASHDAATGLLRRLYKPFQDVDKTFAMALRLGYANTRIQQIMKAKFLVFYNWDDKNDRIKDHLSISMPQLNQINHLIQNYLNEMKATKERATERNRVAQELAAKGNGAQQQQASQQKTPAQKQQAQPQPASTDPPAQKHNRRASSNKVPAAPTDKKTFDWNTAPSAPSPHGVPNYPPRGSELTPDKLNLPPPNKRRRTGQPDSNAGTPTPGANVAPSPNLAGGKGGSPDAARKAQVAAHVAAQEEASRRWRCDKDHACAGSTTGFETEDELKAHVEAEHQEVADPLSFFLDSAATALGVDQTTGLPMQAQAGAKAGAKKPMPKTAAGEVMKRELSATGVKGEVRTPANTGLTPATPGSGQKPAVKNAAPAEAKALDKPKTLGESMATNLGFDLAAGTAMYSDEFGAAIAPFEWWRHDGPMEINWDLMFGRGHADFPNPAANSGDDVDVAMSGTDRAMVMGGDKNVDWGFDLPPEALADEGVQSSPEQDSTPQSLSSRGSDISENGRLQINFQWDPFGSGDMVVPEILKVGELGIESEGSEGQGVGEGGEAGADGGAAADGAAAGATTGAATDPFDWSADMGMSGFGDMDFGGPGEGDMVFDFPE